MAQRPSSRTTSAATTADPPAAKQLPDNPTPEDVCLLDLVVLKQELANRGITHPAQSPKGRLQCLLMHHLGQLKGPDDTEESRPASATATAVVATLAEFKADMMRELDRRNSHFEKRFEALEKVHTALMETKGQVDTLKADNQELHRGTDFLNHQVSELRDTVRELKAKVDDAADQSNVASLQANLCLTKLPNTDSQADAEKSVKDLLETLQVSSQPTGIRLLKPSSYAAAAASRTTQGSAYTGRVVVYFADVQAKKTAYANARKLKGTPFERTHLDDDLTQRQQQARKDQQPLYKQLWEEGKRPRWRGAQIFVAGRAYSPASVTPQRPSYPSKAAPASYTHTNSYQALA